MHIEILEQDVDAVWPGLVPQAQTPLGTPAKATINLERECGRYLAGLMRASPKLQPKRKADYRKECKTLFPGLTGRAFNRAWKKEIKAFVLCAEHEE